jgi:hypothetical protein
MSCKKARHKLNYLGVYYYILYIVYVYEPFPGDQLRYVYKNIIKKINVVHSDSLYTVYYVTYPHYSIL